MCQREKESEVGRQREDDGNAEFAASSRPPRSYGSCQKSLSRATSYGDDEGSVVVDTNADATTAPIIADLSCERLKRAREKRGGKRSGRSQHDEGDDSHCLFSRLLRRTTEGAANVREPAPYGSTTSWEKLPRRPRLIVSIGSAADVTAAFARLRCGNRQQPRITFWNPVTDE